MLPLEITVAVLNWYVSSWACEVCGVTVPPKWEDVSQPGFGFPSWGPTIYVGVAGGYRHELRVSPLCSGCERVEEGDGD